MVDAWKFGNRRAMIGYSPIFTKRFTVVYRYKPEVITVKVRSSAFDALDLAVSPETISETFSKVVFFAGSRTTDEKSSLSVRAQSDSRERGTRQMIIDIDENRIAEDKSNTRLCAPRCNCEYLQPPDADLITVDVDHFEGDNVVKRNTTRRSENGESRPHSKRSQKSVSSWWKRSKRFATDIAVDFMWRIFLCC
ncbi:unnamed protein product [Aphis gossypii]|uniref:Uncharacterized protein n=1 Tax=Aphis gossypii TaxID=80765 RepID=A0A9P0JDB7_APHGO|nr:unnamed protein product [Aphis gossypii]